MLVGVGEVLLPIGRFARVCRLSVKQRRHCDDLGLLRPAWVDPDSGYRCYRAGQAREALSIGLLRSLDVPRPAIGRVLAGGGIADVPGGVRDQMAADLVRRRRMLAALDRVLTGGLPRAEVRLTREGARRAAATQGGGGAGEIPAVTSDCVTRLSAALEAAGEQPRGPVAGLFPRDLADQVTVTVAAPAGRDVAGARRDILRGGLFATATHAGP